MKYTAGIDEAGRGACLGPITMAIVVAGPEGEKELKQMRIRDSKRMSSSKREQVFEAMQEGESGAAYVSWVQQPASMVDSTNLNALEHKMAHGLMEPLMDKPNINFVIDDFTNHKWRQMGFPKNVKFQVQADRTNIVVSTASVVAKVMRDKLMKKLLNDIDLPYVSGYPGDEKTMNLLHEYYDKHGNLPDFARMKWSTCKRIVNASV